MTTIGVLALQGAFANHKVIFERLGAQVVEVRLPRDLEAIDALVIPGGESTTIGKLAVAYELMMPLRIFAQKKPVWGTCAGAIFLSKDAQREQPLLQVMDITVQRNAFGAQVASFEVPLNIPFLKYAGVGREHKPFNGIFIRAPLIERVGEGVEILVQLANRKIVAARQGHLIATSFHPEMANDDRFHQAFIGFVESQR